MHISSLGTNLKWLSVSTCVPPSLYLPIHTVNRNRSGSLHLTIQFQLKSILTVRSPIPSHCIKQNACSPWFSVSKIVRWRILNAASLAAALDDHKEHFEKSKQPMPICISLLIDSLCGRPGSGHVELLCKQEPKAPQSRSHRLYSLSGGSRR